MVINMRTCFPLREGAEYQLGVRLEENSVIVPYSDLNGEDTGVYLHHHLLLTRDCSSKNCQSLRIPKPPVYNDTVVACDRLSPHL